MLRSLKQRLTAGFLIGLAGLSLFAGITEDVIHHERMTQFDVALLDWLQHHATPRGYAIFGAISHLGSFPAMAVLTVGVGLVLALQRQWIPLGGWVAALAGGGLLDVALKLLIRRPRPIHAVTFVAHPSWSFPSGHAMGSLIGYGMLSYLILLLWTWRRRARIAVVASAALLIVAIGVSRIYLGVHYFSDVIGGYAVGIMWLSTCICGVEVARRWRARPTRLSA